MRKLVIRMLFLNGLALCALVATLVQNVAFAQAKQTGVVAPTAGSTPSTKAAASTKTAPVSKAAPVSKDTPATPKQAAVPKAPAWIEKALRARVEGMLLARKEGSFQKAYDFVAPDSRDYFFQMEKAAITTYKIEDIQWSDRFTRAMVRVSTIRKTRLMGVPGEIELPGSLEEAWKNTAGRWMWWHDPKLDRMGLLATPTITTQTPAASAAKAPIPSDVSPAAVSTAAKSIGPVVMFDKTSLTFVEGKASTETVTYGNLNAGEIRVQAEMLFQPKGYTVTPVDTWLKPKETVKYQVHYEPGEGVLKQVTLRLYVEPFGKFYQIPIQVSPVPRN